jgi:hypothetical protein
MERCLEQIDSINSDAEWVATSVALAPMRCQMVPMELLGFSESEFRSRSVP